MLEWHNDIVQHGTCNVLGANECCAGNGLTKGTKDLKQSLKDYPTMFHTTLNSDNFFQFPGEGKRLGFNEIFFDYSENAVSLEDSENE